MNRPTVSSRVVRTGKRLSSLANEGCEGVTSLVTGFRGIPPPTHTLSLAQERVQVGTRVWGHSDEKSSLGSLHLRLGCAGADWKGRDVRGLMKGPTLVYYLPLTV